MKNKIIDCGDWAFILRLPDLASEDPMNEAELCIQYLDKQITDLKGELEQVKEENKELIVIIKQKESLMLTCLGDNKKMKDKLAEYKIDLPKPFSGDKSGQNR